MKARRTRRTRFTTTAAGLGLAALIAVVGAAQAAPTMKTYSATVNVDDAQIDTEAGTATLKLTLKNESKQTLGSANFDPPDGVTVTNIVQPEPAGWDIGEALDDVVTFRSTTPLTKGQSVSANVEVSILSACTDATWTTRAKQSNDFSGNPGNDFSLDSDASNLRPLGSFDMTDIETEVDDPSQTENVFVPQIVVSAATSFDVTAYDICGEILSTYGSGFGDSASFDAEPDDPQRLVGASISDLTWAGGTDTVTLVPAVIETGDFLVIADETTKISDTSNEFDVVEELCTGVDSDTTCELSSPGGGKIHVQAPKPPAPEEGADVPSLGFGFNPDLPTFDCNGESDALGETFVNINPRDYPANATVTVTLTYDKSIIGNGPASAHRLCLSKDNGLTWTFESPVPACPADPTLDDAPCIIEQKKTNGGDLLVVLFLEAADPFGGMT